MDTPGILSLEQEFQLKVFKAQVENLSKEPPGVLTLCFQSL